ncbi:NAD-dependent epimerase/dehydratase family protein [Gammaproteobacteria bacterium]|nr:NAD-dependent epimerase/dehydratase family protein [Gammaproteobacteria bacterium]
MKKTIFVTGITGFIGRNLLNHLLVQFDQVINFTRHGTVQVIAKGGISEHEISQDIILSNPSETLVNLATLYEPYPRDDLGLQNLIEANILFPSRVLEALGSINNLKVINALSYHQLLDFSSQSVYSLSKELFKKFLDYQDKEVVNVYIFDTFGAGDTREKVTDTFIKNILAGHAIKIPKNEIKINLSDSEAISMSLIQSLQMSAGSYSLSSPNTLSLESLALIIMDLTNTKVEIIKQNTSINHFNLIRAFPKNAFVSPPSYDFIKSLEKRINDIKNET